MSFGEPYVQFIRVADLRGTLDEVIALLQRVKENYPNQELIVEPNGATLWVRKEYNYEHI